VCISKQSRYKQNDRKKESYHFNLHTYMHYYALKEEAMMARGALARQGGVLAMARKEWEQHGSLK
jgi:hypothetical protein